VPNISFGGGEFEERGRIEKVKKQTTRGTADWTLKRSNLGKGEGWRKPAIKRSSVRGARRKKQASERNDKRTEKGARGQGAKKRDLLWLDGDDVL